jgi:broad specificity phosphatase PhoE
LSTLYLVRHGQAGTRDAYDSLSELGKCQAQLLGEHFVSQGIQFTSGYAGGLLRQQQTAEQICAAYAHAGGVGFPIVSVDAEWDEFDLGRVYREIAPQLASDDPEFCREYEEMREQVRATAGAHGASIHRKWLPCDTKIVEAWAAGRYPYGGETWLQFRERIAACSSKMHDARGENILVVTSATPIAICTGLSLEITDGRVMRLAGAVYNASYTVLRLRHAELRLFTFNAVPHLAAPGMRTHR